MSTTQPALVGAVIPDLKGKAVLITGASTGIGAAAARAFGRNGARVAISYNSSRDQAEAVAADIERGGGEALLLQGDVTDPAMAARLTARTAEAFGRIDVLVNNAGALVRRTPVAEYSDEYLDAVLDINVRQVVRFVRETALQMRRQGGGGSIINLTSIAARHGGGPGSVIYAGAKGFISTVTKGWAKELVKDRIRVNAVSPGVIMTPFHERFSTPEQLAGMQATIPWTAWASPRNASAPSCISPPKA